MPCPPAKDDSGGQGFLLPIADTWCEPMISTRAQAPHGLPRLSPKWRNFLTMLAFISPWLIGFLVFFVYPTLSSLYYSFTSYNVLEPPRWIGAQNYAEMIEDSRFWNSLYNSVFYTVIAVPLNILVAFTLALVLNREIAGRAALRTLVYVPVVLPVTATAMIWMWMFNTNWGMLNNILALVGIRGPAWLGSPDWSKPSLILMQTWLIGGSILIFLAALQDVPRVLYEAAEVDGAGAGHKLLHISIPMLTPAVLFTLLTGLIGAFQVFASAWIMTNGGPVRSTEFYVLYLYNNGFKFFKMGYASAMAWVLFLIVLVVTFFIFRTSARWVYYGGQED
jgi:multiple sugar transport system permease protein